MTPTYDERLASIIRSLTEVVLPHLPPEASLAQEQVQLAVGHLQILRLQLDAIPAFEAEELADLKALALALTGSVRGGAKTGAALGALRAAAGAPPAPGAEGRAALSALNRAIEAAVQAVSVDGDAGARAEIGRLILAHEASRVEKDRRWFLPFGFDTMEDAA